MQRRPMGRGRGSQSRPGPQATAVLAFVVTLAFAHPGLAFLPRREAGGNALLPPMQLPTGVVAGIPFALTSPELGDGTVTTSRDGFRVLWRPLGLYRRGVDGTRTLLARPQPSPAVADDAGCWYVEIYPGISERHSGGSDFFKRELVVASPGLLELAAGETLLIAWSVELEGVSYLVSVPESGGGLMLFDDDLTPIFWMMAPFVLADAGPMSGVMPSFPTRYELGVSEGQMEIGVDIEIGQLAATGLDLPLVVDLTTLDLE